MGQDIMGAITTITAKALGRKRGVEGIVINGS